MKRWQILLMVTLALVLMVATPMTALAQREEAAPPDSTRLQLKGALAIIAPWVAPVGKEVQMTVFLRENQEPFPGAGVWAITPETAEALREEMAQLNKDDSQPADEKDYEAMMESRGIFLGRTNGDGKILYTFEQVGRYVLVAARKGYLPGFTHIGIREITKALGIESAKRVPPGEKFTLTVFERDTRNPVEDAGVWAVTRDKVEALQADAKALREDTSIPTEEKDYEALVKIHGIFLGKTGNNGKLDYTFEEAGGYLLVAVKRGYVPGFAPLAVIAKPKALGIKATPPQAHVGKEVTLNVFDRESNDVVEGAGIWAVSRDQVEALKEASAALREDKSTTPEEKDYEALVGAHGAFLGKTDEDGKLNVTFNEPGGYLLVAVKRDYIPGFQAFGVKELPQPKPAPQPKVPKTPRPENQNNQNKA